MKYQAALRVAFVGSVLASCTDSYSSGSPPDSTKSVKCDKWESILLADGSGRKVYSVEEGCSGLSNGLTISIDLEAPPGRRTTVFTFADASWDARYTDTASPTVAWTNADKLTISVGAVGAIYKKIGKVGDIDIEYHIDHVLSQEPPSSGAGQ